MEYLHIDFELRVSVDDGGSIGKGETPNEPKEISPSQLTAMYRPNSNAYIHLDCQAIYALFTTLHHRPLFCASHPSHLQPSPNTYIQGYLSTKLTEPEPEPT